MNTALAEERDTLRGSAVTGASRLRDINRAIDLYAYQSPLVEP